MKQKRNKYGNIPTVCGAGHRHPSKGEAGYCDNLHLTMFAVGSTIQEIFYEKSYDLVVNGFKICAHKPDWTLLFKDGHEEIREFKGRETPDWKLKKKLFEAIFPDIKYVVVKKKSTKISQLKRRTKRSVKNGR